VTPGRARKPTMTDRELVRVATEFRKGLLGGESPDRMCFIVSAALEGYLSALGVDVTLERVQFPTIDHCLLRLGDGRVLDATADQWRRVKLPPVYLGPMPTTYQRWMREWKATTRRLKHK
jgi:hypothetical protein